MKAKLTLFNSAKPGFAVCDCQVAAPERGSINYRLLSAVDRATGLLLDMNSVLNWHTEEEINAQVLGLKEKPLPAQVDDEREETRSGPITTSVIPDDCPKKLRRFYEQDETPALPNLGWD